MGEALCRKKVNRKADWGVAFIPETEARMGDQSQGKSTESCPVIKEVVKVIIKAVKRALCAGWKWKQECQDECRIQGRNRRS